MAVALFPILAVALAAAVLFLAFVAGLFLLLTVLPVLPLLFGGLLILLRLLLLLLWRLRPFRLGGVWQLELVGGTAERVVDFAVARAGGAAEVAAVGHRVGLVSDGLREPLALD